jgi:putative DNA primase/helicase
MQDAGGQTNMSTDMLEAALSYARAGLNIFPAHAIRGGKCSCGEIKGCSPGKHPIGALVPRGVLAATVDVKVIAEWWSQVPDANIGIATGKASNLVVLDVDGSAGEDTLSSILTIQGPLPATLDRQGPPHIFSIPRKR